MPLDFADVESDGLGLGANTDRKERGQGQRLKPIELELVCHKLSHRFYYYWQCLWPAGRCWRW
ncbi:hypothetical protein D3C81_2148730 [compost metagenome]